jgi:hypothetical protein
VSAQWGSLLVGLHGLANPPRPRASMAAREPITDESICRKASVDPKRRFAAHVAAHLARRNALTVSATDDVAIAAPLYGLHYFTDPASEDGLRFDYTLRPGVVQSQNAFRLLSTIVSPDELMEEAGRKVLDGGPTER